MEDRLLLALLLFSRLCRVLDESKHYLENVKTGTRSVLEGFVLKSMDLEYIYMCVCVCVFVCLHLRLNACMCVKSV